VGQQFSGSPNPSQALCASQERLQQSSMTPSALGQQAPSKPRAAHTGFDSHLVPKSARSIRSNADAPRIFFLSAADALARTAANAMVRNIFIFELLAVCF